MNPVATGAFPYCVSEGLEQGPSRPLVSVVIPTYNRGPFLKHAIASALAQEQLGVLFDLEIIVVDDCSPDDMAHIATAFPGVQYVRLAINLGASGARNAGIQLAKGKYVALLDDDDEFLTHKLMVQLPILEANPEIGVVYGQSVVTGGDTPLLLWPEWGPSGQVFEEFLTRTEDFLHPPTWLVRRELFEAAGWFDESALERLPATPDAERVRRKARAAVCATIAGQRWSIGAGLESTRTYLLTALRGAPWLLQEPVVLDWVNRVACTLACASQQPVRAVRTFWSEIVQSTTAQATAQSWCTRRLLGAMLEATALDMTGHSPRRAWLVALSVVLHDPHYWIEPCRLLRLYQALSRKYASGPEG